MNDDEIQNHEDFCINCNKITPSMDWMQKEGIRRVCDRCGVIKNKKCPFCEKIELLKIHPSLQSLLVCPEHYNLFWE